MCSPQRRTAHARSSVLTNAGILAAGIRFKHITRARRYDAVGTESGLALRSAYGFEVCSAGCCAGPSAVFVNATIVEGSGTARSLVVRAPDGGDTIQAVRYGHDDMPSLFLGTQLAVYNVEGLPATPGIWNLTAVEGDGRAARRETHT